MVKKAKLQGHRVEAGMVQYGAVPQTLEINGFIYERLDRPTEALEVDLSTFDKESLDRLDTMMDEQGFVSHAECIRHVIRELIKDKTLSPTVQPKKKKKKVKK